MNRLALIRIQLVVTALVATACVGRAQTLYTVVLGNQNHVVGSSTLESGLFVSYDRGESWNQLGPRNLKAYDMDAVISERGRVLYIAAGNGVHRSVDSGKSWKIVTDWKMTEVLDIAIDQQEPRFLYAATAFGLWWSQDGGESWSKARDSIGTTYVYRVESTGYGRERGLDLYTRDRQRPSLRLVSDSGAVHPYSIDRFAWIEQETNCRWSNAYAVIGVNPGTRNLKTKTIYTDSTRVMEQLGSSHGMSLTCTDAVVPVGPPLPSPVHALIAIDNPWPYRLIVGTFGDGLFTYRDEEWVQIGLPGAQVWSIRSFSYR